jgi:hypothetical protein
MAGERTVRRSTFRSARDKFARQVLTLNPIFRHFVGLDKGRHLGLPLGVAKVTRPSAKTHL